MLVAPTGWGSAGQGPGPLLRGALDKVRSRVRWCQVEGRDTWDVPGLRGAGGAGRWAGAGEVPEGIWPGAVGAGPTQQASPGC